MGQANFSPDKNLNIPGPALSFEVSEQGSVVIVCGDRLRINGKHISTVAVKRKDHIRV